MDAGRSLAYDLGMARPKRDPEAIYDEHIAALPDEAKLRLVVLITEAVAERASGRRTRLADLDGLGMDAWEGVDPDAYVRALRDEWQGRP